jgi:hypothetical protein
MSARRIIDSPCVGLDVANRSRELDGHRNHRDVPDDDGGLRGREQGDEDVRHEAHHFSWLG